MQGFSAGGIACPSVRVVASARCRARDNTTMGSTFSVAHSDVTLGAEAARRQEAARHERAVRQEEARRREILLQRDAARRQEAARQEEARQEEKRREAEKKRREEEKRRRRLKPPYPGCEGEWVLREDYNGVKSFAWYYCTCGKKFMSAHGHKKFMQDCQACEKGLRPKFMWENARQNFDRREAPSGHVHHDTTRCEACRHGMCSFTGKMSEIHSRDFFSV